MNPTVGCSQVPLPCRAAPPGLKGLAPHTSRVRRRLCQSFNSSFASARPSRWPQGVGCGSMPPMLFRGSTKVRPNPSLKAPTHYGRQRKPGLSQATIVSVQAYAACLRGRL
jgi:hypothetical protein